MSTLAQTLADRGWQVERAQRRVIDPERFRGEPPSITDGPEEVPLGTILVDPADRDRVLIAYLPYRPVDEPVLRKHAPAVRVPKQARTAGLQVRSLTFGALPRLEVRGREACQAAAFNSEHPDLYRALAAQAAPLEALYEQLAPGVFEHHAGEAATILGDWRLPGSRAFTGGVLNRDSNLGYHFDSGNFTDVFSAMIGLRRGVEGGALVVPELGIHLPIHDRSVSYFDGQGLLHGVTAMRRTSTAGYRITVVYYSTKRLWHCLPPGQELERAQEKRTERAKRRAGLDT